MLLCHSIPSVLHTSCRLRRLGLHSSTDLWSWVRLLPDSALRFRGDAAGSEFIMAHDDITTTPAGENNTLLPLRDLQAQPSPAWNKLHHLWCISTAHHTLQSVLVITSKMRAHTEWVREIQQQDGYKCISTVQA